MKTFRDLPGKSTFTVLLPPEIDGAIRDLAHQRRISLSEAAALTLAKGLGRTPAWSDRPRPRARAATA